MIFRENFFRFYIKTNVYQTKTHKFSTKLATQVYVLFILIFKLGFIHPVSEFV